MEIFLLLAGLDGIIDAENISTGMKAAEWMAKDHKMYVFLIEPNYHTLIVDIKSGQEAWRQLISEYKKDSATTCMALHQQFYSLTHDPAISIVVFIDAVFSIGYKPDGLEIGDNSYGAMHLDAINCVQMPNGQRGNFIIWYT